MSQQNWVFIIFSQFSKCHNLQTNGYVVFFYGTEKKTLFPFTTAAEKWINLVPQRGAAQWNKTQIILTPLPLWETVMDGNAGTHLAQLCCCALIISVSVQPVIQFEVMLDSYCQINTVHLLQICFTAKHFAFFLPFSHWESSVWWPLKKPALVIDIYITIQRDFSADFLKIFLSLWILVWLLHLHVISTSTINYIWINIDETSMETKIRGSIRSWN